MRRTGWGLVVIVLVAGVVVAAPALASFGVIVQLPASAVYSPYGGPATVTFTFEPDDGAAIFTVRIRRPGRGTIKEKDYLVDPATHSSPHSVSFPWEKLSVAAPRDYVVDVRRQDGGPVITSEIFTLLPTLVSGLSAKPSPFYPLVQDGYRDRTKIGFSLAADTAETVVHVFRDDIFGRCCGTEIRTEDLGPLASGAHRWTWDGTQDGGSFAPKGTYFVKVAATDTDAVSGTSKAQRVEVTKGWIRLTATKSKHGSAYARVADEHDTATGGNCVVSRESSTHEAEILCANAEISVYWRWGLEPGERIESASFEIDGGVHGCHRRVRHTTTESFLRVHSPPTSTCSVTTARIKYTYPVRA
jgi:hypothetical protein